MQNRGWRNLGILAAGLCLGSGPCSLTGVQSEIADALAEGFKVTAVEISTILIGSLVDEAVQEFND